MSCTFLSFSASDALPWNTIGKVAAVAAAGAVTAAAIYHVTKGAQNMDVKSGANSSSVKTPPKSTKKTSTETPPKPPRNSHQQKQTGIPPPPARSRSSTSPTASTTSSSSSLSQQSRRSKQSKGPAPPASINGNPAPRPPPKTSVDVTTIVISASGTEQCAGGLLILPRSNWIFFYSIEWSQFFKLPKDPARLEMLSAGLALEFFSSYVKKYRERQGTDTLVVKTSSVFSAIEKNYRTFVELLNVKLHDRPFEGIWREVNCAADKHMKITTRLSENDWKTSIHLPKTTPAHDYLRQPDGSYKLRNISITDKAALHAFALNAKFLDQA